MTKSLRVLIVDDSPTVRLMLAQSVNSAADMQVAGAASNGVEAVELAKVLQPDVILMDAVMPQMNGLEATREIMCEAPTRIIMVSASQIAGEASFALEAIRAGALTVIPKPIGFPGAQHLLQVNELLSTIRLMADVQVIHHWKRAPGEPRVMQRLKPRPEIVGIVASSGGPAALSQIVFQLPADFHLSMVIVQHIAADFVQS